MDAADITLGLELADAAPGSSEAVAALRRRFPAIRVVAVDAMDMRGEIPAARGHRRGLWLARSDGHCWGITDDPARVDALLVADLPPVQAAQRAIDDH